MNFLTSKTFYKRGFIFIFFLLLSLLFDDEISASKKEVKKDSAKTSVKENKQDLSKLSVAELKKIASEKGISGVSSLKKADLIKKLS